MPSIAASILPLGSNMGDAVDMEAFTDTGKVEHEFGVDRVSSETCVELARQIGSTIPLLGAAGS
jgi:hypothetical protein